MKLKNASRRNFLTIGVSALVLSNISGNAQAWPKIEGKNSEPATLNPDLMFIDSNAAQLSGVKKVIIANYVIAFQTEAKAFHEATRFNKAESAAANTWDNVDLNMLQEITDAGYKKLKNEFIANGIEVLDPAVLNAQPAYQNIQKATGFGSPAFWGNADGKAIFVSATGLAPFQSYGPETGNFEMYNGKSEGSAANPPTMMKRLTPYQLPGWEIDLAAALGAVVVKAWQVVEFAKVEAGANRWGFGTGNGTLDRAEVTASASSHLRIRQEQSRLAFRLPNSKNRTGVRVRTIPNSYMAPPKDGDVVVALGNPIFLGSDLFKIEDKGETSKQKVTKLLIGGATHFNFSAHLEKPEIYKARVSIAITDLMNKLVKTAFTA